MNRSDHKAPVGDSNNFIYFIAIFLAVLCLIEAWHYGSSANGYDFYYFWAVPRALSEGIAEDIYSEEGYEKLRKTFADRAEEQAEDSKYYRMAEFWNHSSRAHFRPANTPFSYTVFRLFSLGDFEKDFRRYQFISLICSAASIFLICRMLGFSIPGALFLMVLFFQWFEPVRSDMRIAGVNRLLLLMPVAYLGLKRYRPAAFFDFSAGVVMGFSLMFKPILLPMLGAFFLIKTLNGRLKECLYEIVGVLTAAADADAVSTFFFGSPACWLEWFDYLRQVEFDNIGMIRGNYGLKLFIEEKFNVASLPVITGLCLAIVITVGLIILFKWLKEKRMEQPVSRKSDSHAAAQLIVLGLGVIIYVIISPLAWAHYFVLLFPSIAALIRLNVLNSGRRATLIKYAIIALSLFLFTVNPLFGTLEKNTAIDYPWIRITGVFTLLILILSEFPTVASVFLGLEPDK